MLTGIKNLLIELFVPSDNYFVDRFEGIKTKAETRLGATNLDGLGDLAREIKSDNIRGELNVNGVSWYGSIVNFDIVNEYKSIFQGWVFGFMMILLSIYNYSQVLWLIRGNTPISSTTAQISRKMGD